MPRNLIIFGLALIAAAILFRLVSLIIEIAVPAGIGLIIVGIIWHLLVQPRRRRR